MPNNFSYPFILEYATNISMTDLRKWKYLVPGKRKSGSITWTKAGLNYAAVSITVDFREEDESFIEIEYSHFEKSYHLKIDFDFLFSNLGKGLIWYFRCPATGRLCRKIYFYRGNFVSRFAINNCMYKIQTKSHRDRKFEKQLEKAMAAEKLYPKLSAKHFKTYYDGKSTKRYLHLTKRINESLHSEFPDVKSHIFGRRR